MKNKHFLIISLILFIGFLIFTAIKFFEIKPFMDNLFKNADNLTYNQKLIDTTIVFFDEVDNKIVLSLKDSLCFNFFSSKQIGLENKFTDNCYNIDTNFKTDLLNFKIKNNVTAKLFKCDTSTLPLKYKKINMPYKISVNNYKIIDSKVYN